MDQIVGIQDLAAVMDRIVGIQDLVAVIVQIDEIRDFAEKVVMYIHVNQVHKLISEDFVLENERNLLQNCDVFE